MTKELASILHSVCLFPGLTRNLKGLGRFQPFLSLGKSFSESGERRFGNRQYTYTLIPGLIRNFIGFGRFLLSQERGELDSRLRRGTVLLPIPSALITSSLSYPHHGTIIPHTHVVCVRYDSIMYPNREPA